MPVAEPSGEYEVAMFVDLAPLYGKIEDQTKLTITQPPEDILEQRLKQLESDDVAVRRTAAADLAYFPEHSDRVFNALLKHLDDPDETLRSAAFYSMARYTDQIEKRIDVFLKILGNEESPENFRISSAYYVSRYGPISDETEVVLESLLKSYEGHDYESSFKHYLKQYRERAAAETEEKTG